MKRIQQKVLLGTIILVLLAACGASVSISPASPDRTPATTEATATPADLSITGSLDKLKGLPIDRFIEESFIALSLRDPDGLIVAGMAEQLNADTSHFTNISDAYIRQTQDLEDGVLALLHGYNRNAFTSRQQVSYDTYEWYLRSLVEGHKYMYYPFLVSGFALRSVDMSVQDFLINYFPIKDETDARAYIGRLDQFPDYFEQVLEGLRLREQQGIIPPRLMIEMTLQQIDGTLQLDSRGSPQPESMGLYNSFMERIWQIPGLSRDTTNDLKTQALVAMRGHVAPAYLKLQDYLRSLLKKAGESPDLTRLTDGAAYYQYALWKETGTDLTAEQIHQIGLHETKRIQGEMQALAHSGLGLPADISMEALMEALNAHASFYSGSQALQKYRELYAGMKSRLAQYFDLVPESELQIVAGPMPYMNYYAYPAVDGSRPGIFYSASAGSMDYLIPTTFYHEGIPGHHLTGALSIELDMPAFQRVIGINSYIEGWALYAEHLALEMGMYADDPYGNLGRLSLELMRAVRLVVDTGMNAMGWSYKKAVDYWNDAMGSNLSVDGMVRYTAIPGQGCSYMIGYLKIMELRQRAEEVMGAKFDIKEFHDVVLKYGPVPMEVLERLVDEWIEGK